jgi:hypothetical protein
MMSYRSSLAFVILSLLLRELKKGETFASLLNIHGGDIRSDTSSFYVYINNLTMTPTYSTNKIVMMLLILSVSYTYLFLLRFSF